MWVDRNSTLTTCISGGLILNNACVAPDIFVVYLRFNVVIAIWLEVMAFDETDSRWRSWVCAAGFVLIYASELTKCSFGYFTQECLSLFDIIYLPWATHMSMPSAEPLVTKVCYIAQPMIKTARFSALPISRGDFAPHNLRRTHSSPVRARYGCSWVTSVTEVLCSKFMLYAIPRYIESLSHVSMVNRILTLWMTFYGVSAR